MKVSDNARPVKMSYPLLCVCDFMVLALWTHGDRLSNGKKINEESGSIVFPKTNWIYLFKVIHTIDIFVISDQEKVMVEQWNTF